MANVFEVRLQGNLEHIGIDPDGLFPIGNAKWTPSFEQLGSRIKVWSVAW